MNVVGIFIIVILAFLVLAGPIEDMFKREQ